ncbi:uncharacterized protein BX664DRAFT_362509 [Halteromyces radiatus]|uniref:uncharacterized protein n=1 Tax=Halteromyces radiatus TaxID=101107 RepID=UPI00221E559F|nr:uncharacterized protein BX664DRAFT_362509 [Halteromyces radiatus]KAI8077721.1 hypothetical protein BX664DRAFT_362509 [Halteromyces radiatus]
MRRPTHQRRLSMPKLTKRLTNIRWNQTQQLYKKEFRRKRCYYLSMELLIGRALNNALYALHAKTKYSEAVHSLGFSMEDLLDQERDAALAILLQCRTQKTPCQMKYQRGIVATELDAFCGNLVPLHEQILQYLYWMYCRYGVY